jgi:hypothetical protein
VATKTVNIGLVKPDFSEFTDSWYIPLNRNFDIIDEEIGALKVITDDAKGTALSLALRLNISLNPDGSLKDVPEIAKARNSSVYGADDGTTNFVLDERLERGDREAFDARGGLTSLLAAGAFAADDFVPNSVVSAPTSFLTFTGANVKVDGSVTPVVANINGYRREVRTLKSTAISGVAGNYYIYLDSNLAGEIILSRLVTGTENTGAVGVDVNSRLKKFTDSTQNFITAGVKPGDILEITTTGSLNKYQYPIATVIDANNLTISGWFETSQANLNYKITNPLAPVLGFTATPHAKRFARVQDRLFIGKCVFDGANVTSVTQYGLKGRYEEWFSVSLLGGDYAIIATHMLGYMPTKVAVYASQANDFSAALDPLAIAQVSGVGVTDDRAAVVDMTDTTIRVKNPTNGVFYKDYAGTTHTTGFILVVAER